MRDADTLVQTIRQIERILAEHIEPGHAQDDAVTVERIFLAMDQHDAASAADRLAAGYGVLRLVK